MDNINNITRQSLAYFKTYLLYVRKISKATADDYCKRIRKICRDENITYSELEQQIEQYVSEYTEGKKRDIGSMSHNSYSNALKQFAAYVKCSSDFVVEWRYKIVCGKTKSGYPNISVLDEKHNETISTVTFGLPNSKNSDESSYQMISTMVQLCLPILFKENPSAILDFLEENGFKITFDN